MRKKRLIFNTASAIINQIITFICGFILPRQILIAFGSETNGLISSITQFLGIINFLDLGIGTVVQSSLYKPLSKGNNDEVNSIIYEAKRFFSTIAKILILYTILLMVFYPLMIKNQESNITISYLIFAISLSTISQYLFGIVNQLLLNADQKGYVNLIAQSLTTIVNTIACIFLIKKGASIVIVKLISAIILMMRPILLYIYVKNKYKLKAKKDDNKVYLRDKWSATAQHIATTVVDKTDIVVLSTLSTLKNVSIYTVYHLIVSGLYQAFLVLTSGIQSFLGDIYAKEEYKKFNESLKLFEFLIHNAISLIFSCTMTLIIPFVRIYTKGITDVNYIVPIFSVVIILAFEFACYRSFYNIIIKSVGHYRQTQKGSINEAIINLGLSIVFVYKFGLIGVAVGTLASMVYRTIYLINYINKNILDKKNSYEIKLFANDFIISVIIVVSTAFFKECELNYFSWILYSIRIVAISTIELLVINLLLNRKELHNLKTIIAKK